jgi:uncharacterized protein
MRVFLDTNVHASAVATRGLCADILRTVLAAGELVTSEDVLRELSEVLVRKFGVPREAAMELDRLLRREALVVLDPAPADVHIQDRDDLPILGAAMAGDAQVFVTGDQELQSLGRIGRPPILSPRQFWEKNRKRSG